jgi:hypothetical protein
MEHCVVFEAKAGFERWFPNRSALNIDNVFDLPLKQRVRRKALRPKKTKLATKQLD